MKTEKCVYYFFSISLIFAVLCTLQSCSRPTPPLLPHFHADKKASLSGLSSGGFMAVQVHIAHSQSFKGVGVFAAGPYDCAQGSTFKALGECMNPVFANTPAIEPLVKKTHLLATQGNIDPVDNLKTSKVWLFSGKSDSTVHPQVVAQLEKYYQEFIPPSQITRVSHINAGHGIITKAYGQSCNTTGSPFINKCDYDGAGEVLSHIYGPLNPRANHIESELLEFDQTPFVDDKKPGKYGLAEKGYVYVPKSCRTSSCGIHVFLHGCQQNAEKIGTELVEHAGFNEWAETNNLIILYPQTKASLAMPVNPMGCWDWWGYSDTDYETKEAPQIKAIMAMVNHLASP